MNKRIVVLLILLVCIWGVAIYFLFFYGKGAKSPVAQTPQQIPPLRRKLSVDDIKKISNAFSTNIEKVDLFEPYALNFDREKLNMNMLSSIEPLSDYKFSGYIKGETDRFILLSDGARTYTKSPDDVLDNRYLILHVTSFAVAVLDLQTGNLYTIR
ncbi:MAG: hypothetical protein ACPLVG_00545 [Pseudothermotoga sp.]